MPNQPLTRDEARTRARLLSEVSYQTALRLEDGDAFESDTIAEFTCAEPGAGTFIDLEALEVVSAELNGRPVPAEAFNGSRLELEGLAERNRLRVVARCAYGRTGSGLHRFVDPVDGETYVHTQFEPFDAHRVLACFDQPDLRAPLRLRVWAPDGWAVIANSAPDGDAAGGWRSFAPTQPISTYLYAMCAGPYQVVRSEHRGIPLGIWCRRSLLEHLDAEEIFDVTRSGLDFFEALFDHPYAFGKYDQVFVPECSVGAMENPGCITFTERYIFRARVTEAAREARASTILHEMAHMWFGDLVTMRWWDDLWLNESFATYMATLSLARATRFTNAWVTFANEEKTWAVAQDQLPSTHPIVADMTDTDAVRTNFDGITYAKGASVLRQLVAWVGEEAFTAGVRTYFRRHRFANAELGDFLAVLEESSGRELDSWAGEWLQTAGVNTLRPVPGPGGTGVAIAQDAPAHLPTPLRRHRLAVGRYAVQDGALRRVERAELDVAGPLTPVEGVGPAAAGELLLVNDDDLTFAKIRLDPPSQDTALRHLSRLDAALARSLCWAAAWDMTRDAELPASRWVVLVTEHAAAEDDIGTMQRLLGQAELAADLYADPHHRGALRERLATRAEAALDAAEPGSDVQLAWARTLISTAAGERLAFVRALLDGTTQIAGLVVDTDLRWHIVATLAAAGAAGRELVDAELERDPSDIGRRRAAGALASIPDPAAKREAWERVTTDRELPLATLGAIMGGFHRPGQEELLRPYIDPYVELLPEIWRDRATEEAMALTGGLYPTWIVDQSVVAAADRALALGLPATADRILAENRDRTLRAMRARAADG
ncbi:MAG TPA: aminopeptidase N [Candidatus Dormibacteraeota bacterium]|nr:aminopeptidase N [Candidatus Dormibacteraeota bacterium]